MSTVGLWIDQSRAVVLFPHSLRAHLIQSASLSRTHYYDNVIQALGPPGSLLIMGPCAAKTELKERLAQASKRSGWVVEVEPTPPMSDRDVLATLSGRLDTDDQ
jgi:hypothetical protein